MPHLTVGNHQLEYAWCGPRPDEAPTLVFLHEGLGSVAMWRDFPERVVAATGFGALVYSRAGYWDSDPIDLPRPVRFMHDEALITLPQVLNATGVREAIFVGHSDAWRRHMSSSKRLDSTASEPLPRSIATAS